MLLELALVAAITDGDTVKVLDRNDQQYTVRLASIDARSENNLMALKPNGSWPA